jgi:HAE1 family hydrophobic/amphiphilic exporter-1
MFIEGFVREIFYQLALTISFSLLASLIIALTFVPTLANKIMKDDE